MMKKHKIVVIGGGPAGITLAKLLGKKDIAIIRPENASMIYCAMPYVIEGLIPHKDTLKSDTLVTAPGAVLIRDSVKKINFDNKILKMESGDNIAYDKLVIATGADPFIPPVPGHNLNGVMGFKTESQMGVINQWTGQGEGTAVVVGAGAIGIELVQALNHRGVNVHLVDMADSVLPNMIDKEMSTSLEKELIESGVNIHLNSKVTAIEGEKTAQTAVLDSGKKITLKSKLGFDGLVIFAAGMKPEVSLIKDSDIKIERDGIVVNDKMETTVKDIYAVGDCCQFYSGITGKVLSGKLATNAVPMGKIAAHQILGNNRTYPGFYNGAATKVGKFYAGSTGLTEKTALEAGYEIVIGTSNLTTKFPIIPGSKKKTMKLICDKKTHCILGAQIVSEEPVVGRIDLLTFAIQKESTVEDMAALSYAAQPHQSFYPAANLLVLSSEDVLRQL